MKSVLSVAWIALFLGALAGCSQEKAAETPAAPSAPAAGTTASTPPSGGAKVVTGAPQGSIKVGDKAVCAVCAVKEGKTELEEVKATLDYKGKTYSFCSLDEKAEFISNPSKYTGK